MRSALCAFALLLVGCYTPYVVRPGAIPPATTQVPTAERGLLWQRAVGVLLEEGYVPQVLNEAACYVSGRQREDADYGALSGTMAIVTIAPDGVLRVEVSGGGLYQTADDINGDVSKRQMHLLRRIVGQSEPSPAHPGAT
jgi:hypothetical protein